MEPLHVDMQKMWLSHQGQQLATHAKIASMDEAKTWVRQIVDTIHKAKPKEDHLICITNKGMAKTEQNYFIALLTAKGLMLSETRATQKNQYDLRFDPTTLTLNERPVDKSMILHVLQKIDQIAQWLKAGKCQVMLRPPKDKS